jgi:hypothetical protein
MDSPSKEHLLSPALLLETYRLALEMLFEYHFLSIKCSFLPVPQSCILYVICCAKVNLTQIVSHPHKHYNLWTGMICFLYCRIFITITSKRFSTIVCVVYMGPSERFLIFNGIFVSFSQVAEYCCVRNIIITMRQLTPKV